MAESPTVPRINVLAGTNGAGKSSIGGEMFRCRDVEYFNPDEAARKLRAANPAMSVEDGNAQAWQIGRELLQRAISQRLNFNFETTLGGHTMTALLEQASLSGFEVAIWYAGLSSPELHIKRVRARVAKGGHAIADETIRKRYDSGRENLIRLLASIAELRLYDNSAEADPDEGDEPRPILILHYRRREIVEQVSLSEVPDWAKPIVIAAMKLASAADSVE